MSTSSRSALVLVRRMLAAVAVMSFLAAPVMAWNDTGHMVSAWIAWRELKPEVRARVTELLRQHPRYQQDLLRDMPEGFGDPNLYAFMKAATWPDMLRATAHPMHASAHRSNWHYIDLPLVPRAEREKIRPPAPDEEGGPIDNALKAFNKLSDDLKSAEVEPAQKAQAICWILHIVGDIHQPLHTTALFSEQFPEGDRGGNSFMVRSGGEVINLHYLWDAMLGSHSNPRAIELVARNVLANPNHQRASLGEALARPTFRAWVLESHADCREFTYMNCTLRGAVRGKETAETPTGSGPATAPSAGVATAPTTRPEATAGGGELIGPARRRGSFATTVPALPQGYEEVGRQLAAQRIALAGYRLADQLNAMLAKP